MRAHVKKASNEGPACGSVMLAVGGTEGGLSDLDSALSNLLSKV